MTTEQLLQVLASRLNADGDPPTIEWVKNKVAQAQIAQTRELTPEQQALQAAATQQRNLAAQERAQAKVDEVLKDLPADPTPDDRDAIAERLEAQA